MDWNENELAHNAYYDYQRFAKHSFALESTSKTNRQAIIRILTHFIEGGMSFPEVRLGYGQEKIHTILDKLEQYLSDYSEDDTAIWALSTIESYITFNEENGFAVDAVRERLQPFLLNRKGSGNGGSERVTREQIEAATAFDFRKFILNRHSVRQYTDEKIDDQKIIEIVRNAQECSSVCNRQTIKIYAFNDFDTIQELLAYQAGNAGFRQEIRTLFIVTADISNMNLIGERYQGWIDGGIFAQNLALSIHAEGLGACFLNWSVEKETDIALRSKVEIPDNEFVITFMSAGYLKEEFNVPVSARKSVDDILRLNPSIN